MEEVVKDQSQEAQPQESKENAQPKHVLLNAISYDDPADYDKFFENLDVNQALFVLMSGCTSAQTRGAYTLEEAELIAKAIRTIKGQTPPAEENSSEEAESSEETSND